MVFSIPKEELIFPDPHLGEPDGLLCIGGDLSPERLLLAYHHGIFPWFSFTSCEPHWYCPMQRFVIFPAEIHVSHSMRSLINKGKYRVSVNEDFDGVIHGCSLAQDRINEDGAWLGDDIIEAYTMEEVEVSSADANKAAAERRKAEEEAKAAAADEADSNEE